MNDKQFKDALNRTPKIDKKAFILNHINGQSVLDLGCIGHTWERAVTDPSWLHRSVVQKSSDCVGIDFLRDDVVELNKMGYDTIFYGDATDLTLERKFDIIILGDLIEHVHDIRGLFETFDKHLNYGGKIVITTPNPFFINHFITILLTNQISVNAEHVFWYDPKVIRELGRRFSYGVNHIEWLVDSDKISFSESKKSFKTLLFYILFKGLLFFRLLKYFRAYYSSEFGVILTKNNG